jgi:glycogen debranching enzyme
MAPAPLPRSDVQCGQVLFGIVPEEGSEAGETLFEADSFSGWGIRTVAAGQNRYNPMSYHNGSVWPHDNAVIAAGLGRYGLRNEASRLLHAFLSSRGPSTWPGCRADLRLRAAVERPDPLSVGLRPQPRRRRAF